MKLLKVTFSKKMPIMDKLNAISEMGIAITEELEGRVNTMCNLSEGLIEEGRKEGLQEGRKEGLQEGRIIEAVIIYRDEMHMSDDKILDVIMNKFSLSMEEASVYMSHPHVC